MVQIKHWKVKHYILKVEEMRHESDGWLVNLEKNKRKEKENFFFFIIFVELIFYIINVTFTIIS